MTLSLAWLLDPITPPVFFADYYERQPLLIARGESRRFVPPQLGAVDRFLATTSPCHPDVFLIVSERRVTRRSLLGALGLGAGAAATVIFAAERAPAADASSKKKKAAKKPAKKPKEEETDKD